VLATQLDLVPPGPYTPGSACSSSPPPASCVATEHAVLLEITVAQIFFYSSEQLAATLNLSRF
jgi:hypothetical protein